MTHVVTWLDIWTCLICLTHVHMSSTWMSHVTTCEWVMPRICVSSVAHRSACLLCADLICCDMTHPCVRHVQTYEWWVSHVTYTMRRTHKKCICDVTHDEWVTSRIQWDAHTRNALGLALLLCVSGSMCDVTHSMRDMTTMRRTQKKCRPMRDTAYAYVWHDSFTCCDVTYSGVRHVNPYQKKTYAKHNSCTCVLGTIEMCCLL